MAATKEKGVIPMNKYRAGIDIGSTTVKLTLLDSEDNIVFGEYKRHMAWRRVQRRG